MPYADSAATAARWATERAIDAWTIVAGDLPEPILAALRPGLDLARLDGARVVLVQSDDRRGRPDELAVADSIAFGPLDGPPVGLFAAVLEAGLDDVRRLGVIGTTGDVLRAAARTGSGAIVGLAPRDSDARRALLRAQPDTIVEPEEFGALDTERYATRRSHRERVLLTPGPTLVTDRVHRAVGGPDLCHREPEYSELVERVRRKLLTTAGATGEWGVVLLSGSGTAAMEAMTGAFVRPGRRLLVCRNGTYGDRIATIAARLGIETVEVCAPDTIPIDVAQVDAALASDPAIDAVAVVHHETTKGLLNPVHEIAAVATAHDVVVLVDAISSLGAEELRLAGSGIDVVAGTSNKCLHGLPGVAFLLVSPRAHERTATVPPRSLYFDVPNYLRAQARHSVPFTPAIPALYGLEAALDELADEGIAARRAHYRARIAVLDAELARLGLEPSVAPGHRSSSVRSLPLPEGVTYARLHDALREDGYVIYAGLGAAAQASFRVCALGALEPDVLRGFGASLERALARSTPVPAWVPAR